MRSLWIIFFSISAHRQMVPIWFLQIFQIADIPGIWERSIGKSCSVLLARRNGPGIVLDLYIYIMKNQWFDLTISGATTTGRNRQHGAQCSVLRVWTALRPALSEKRLCKPLISKDRWPKFTRNFELCLGNRNLGKSALCSLQPNRTQDVPITCSNQYSCVTRAGLWQFRYQNMFQPFSGLFLIFVTSKSGDCGENIHNRTNWCSGIRKSPNILSREEMLWYRY